MTEIKPILMNYWFGYTFEDKVAYSSIKGVKMALLSRGYKLPPKVSSLPLETLKLMVKYVMYYDIIYRTPETGTGRLRAYLDIPNHFPDKIEDNPWDRMYEGIRRYHPEHKLFNIVEIQESDIVRFKEKGLI